MQYRIFTYIGAFALLLFLVACGPTRTAEERKADYQAAVLGWCATMKLTHVASSCREVSGSHYPHPDARCDVRTVENGVVPIVCWRRGHCEIGGDL